MLYLCCNVRTNSLLSINKTIYNVVLGRPCTTETSLVTTEVHLGTINYCITALTYYKEHK